MAVANYKLHGGDEYGPKDFPPPKRADLKYWYKSVRKTIRQLPEWQESFRRAQVDVETIVFDLPDGTLFIARKRNLR